MSETVQIGEKRCVLQVAWVVLQSEKLEVQFQLSDPNQSPGSGPVILGPDAIVRSIALNPRLYEILWSITGFAHFYDARRIEDWAVSY